MNGIGLTNRQLRDKLNQLSEKELDEPAVVVGASSGDSIFGYDFIDDVVSCNVPLKIGTKKINVTIKQKGAFVIRLQDEEIT